MPNNYIEMPEAVSHTKTDECKGNNINHTFYHIKIMHVNKVKFQRHHTKQCKEMTIIHSFTKRQYPKQDR